MLAELRQNLEAQIREGQLLEALDALLVKLPYGSETYRIVSALITRLNSAKRERARNTISFDEYMRLESQVSADLFDLLARLKEDDFSPASTPASTAESDKKGKYGTVLYRVPDVMVLQETTECLIRVAVEEAEIRKNLDIDEHVEIRTQVEISDVMRAEIVDMEGETFKITSHNAANQLVRATGITEWKFSVMPLRLGVHKLLVKVSIMEIVPGFPEPILRDVSVMETVTVLAQISEAIGGGPTRSEETVDFKPNGQSFAFQSNSSVQTAYETNTPPAEEPPYSPGPTNPPINQTTSRPLRALAMLLAFLVIVPAATWAIAPDLPAYMVAVIQDTPEAYADFIEKHPESPRLEKAYLYRAEVSGQLADLRAYQERFQDSGKYRAQIMGKIAALESKSLESIREQPDSLKIRKFVTEFPESERLAEVKQAVETRTDKRQELLSQVEEAYVSSVKARPTETKVTAYLRDFPKQEKLDEVDAAARSKPEVFSKVQSQLEDAYLKKMEENPTQIQAEEYLDKFPTPLRKEKFEKIMETKPVLKKASEAPKPKRMRNFTPKGGDSSSMGFSAPKLQANPEANKPLLNADAQKTGTQQNLAANKPATPKDSLKMKVEELKRKEATNKEFAGQFGIKFGDAKNDGNGNNPFGKGNEGSGDGGGADTSIGASIGGGLSGRAVQRRSSIKNDTQKIGRVVIEVCVDSEGRVISADYTMRGSTTTDSDLKSKALESARSYVFVPSSKDTECGTLSFNFQAN